jgi:hypothetical protein
MLMSHKLERLDRILRELAEIDLGYPQSQNRIASPIPGAAAALAASGLDGVPLLAEFYMLCDGINMPNIRNGYFIDSHARLLASDSDSVLRIVRRDSDTPVVCFGSTCGGGLFAVERDSGRVLLLPPSLLRDGVYHVRESDMKVVATSIAHLLDRLIEDAVAFVRDDRCHAFMSERW